MEGHLGPGDACHFIPVKPSHKYVKVPQRSIQGCHILGSDWFWGGGIRFPWLPINFHPIPCHQLHAVRIMITTGIPLQARPETTVIPKPAHIVRLPGYPLRIDNQTRIHAIGPAIQAANALCEMTKAIHSLSLSVSDSGHEVLSLEISPDLEPIGPEKTAAESYHLICDGNCARVVARSIEGLHHGAKTIAQLMTRGNDGFFIHPVAIQDYPRFPWRGMLLDCGRTFFTVDEICRFIDQMYLHKFNIFHWHLTDDAGWRIEVKQHPRLMEIGSWRSESPQMGNRECGDGLAYGGFYTQDDMRAVVAHAALRHISVVPEIDMPGHCSALIAAMPELGNGDVAGWVPPTTSTRWGVKKSILSPRDQTFRFVAELLDEIIPIFPCPYIHIGGDEAPKDEWKSSLFAQSIIRDHGLGDEHGLQSWFIRRVERLLHERNRRLIGWDEIQEGGLSPSATMMVWRDMKWAAKALEQGNDIIMTPSQSTYLDYGQGAMPPEPEFQHFPNYFTDLERAYGFDPIPQGTPFGQQRQVLGLQGQLWGEYIWSMHKLEYMAWPRGCALSESGWTSSVKDHTEFRRRLASHLDRLERMGINFRRDDGSPALMNAAMGRTPRPPTHLHR
jgi:hexosaminidase